MSGPYGYDVEFGLMVGVCFFLFLCIAAVVECYLDAREDKN